MMWTHEQKEAARAACNEWRGTPHRDRLRLKKKGVDCVNFVAAVLIDAGLVRDFALPYYSANWGIGRRENVMSRLIDELFHVEEVTGEPEFGDLLVFRVGRQSNHIGIVIDGECWHCMTRRFVEPSELDHRIFSDVQTILRLVAPGEKRAPETLVLNDFLE